MEARLSHFSSLNTCTSTFGKYIYLQSSYCRSLTLEASCAQQFSLSAERRSDGKGLVCRSQNTCTEVDMCRLNIPGGWLYSVLNRLSHSDSHLSNNLLIQSHVIYTWTKEFDTLGFTSYKPNCFGRFTQIRALYSSVLISQHFNTFARNCG